MILLVIKWQRHDIWRLLNNYHTIWSFEKKNHTISPLYTPTHRFNQTVYDLFLLVFSIADSNAAYHRHYKIPFNLAVTSQRSIHNSDHGRPSHGGKKRHTHPWRSSLRWSARKEHWGRVKPVAQSAAQARFFWFNLLVFLYRVIVNVSLLLHKTFNIY
jgi:hypothetical protein